MVSRKKYIYRYFVKSFSSRPLLHGISKFVSSYISEIVSAKQYKNV